MTNKTAIDQLQFPELVDIETLASLLGVGVRHVRRLVAEHRIPYIKWGHRIHFDLAAVREWLDAARRPVEDGA